MNVPLVDLSRTLVEAYNWGHAAKNAAAPLRTMEEVIAAQGLPQAPQFASAISTLFEKEGQGIGLFKQADAILDQFPAFEDLREYLIDLCVLQLLGELDEENEDGDGQHSTSDALESAEWLKIEEAAAERGTELLNTLIYIKECKLAEVEPDLEDFLYEFLLADDEDYQDELAIYEPFMKSMDLIEAPLKQLIQAGNNQRDNELRELFTPMMCFFRDAEPQPGKVTLGLLESSALPELHCAIYRLLCAAYHSDL